MPLHIHSVPTAYIVCNEQVWNSAPIHNEMRKLAHNDISSGNCYKDMYGNSIMIMPPTQGYFVGWSINLAKKIAEAAISDGG